MEQAERAKERETGGKSKAAYVSEFGLISESVMRDVCVWQEVPTRVVELLANSYDYVPPNVEDEVIPPRVILHSSPHPLISPRLLVSPLSPPLLAPLLS